MTRFEKILIANRGAIATRIIRTLDRMGIASVAVYAESDRDSLHVQLASEAWSLGEGAASDTYLNIDKLLDIARVARCEAVHPGYGFLSESTTFVEACQAQSLIFIGPETQHILAFGQKHTARELAEAARVPLLPGTGLLRDVEQALQAAADIAYPVMLKSTAGGGGIGMQLCEDKQQLTEMFATVRRQGAASFANDGVFLEKAITHARHIEVQVFGDGKGKVVSLGERDCSAQRRNQKVVEETPAPNLPDTLRQELHETAEALLASVHYCNAGTVEFILDADTQEFYFLEVNTRLQVEHGVTEMVYGLDLVEWMILQAGGELGDLSARKAALQLQGHSIQVRLYAEDPFRNFQPCAGPLTQVEFPDIQGLRIEHWIESGIQVPAEFDPMLAKLIVHADSREQCLLKLQESLRKTVLYGSATNLEYLLALSQDNALQHGRVTTRYLDTFTHQPCRVDVIRGGTMTTIQDVPGRVGYWSVGIPPSGPFDSMSFQLANHLLGNDHNAAGLEVTLNGPALQFSTPTQVVVAGADAPVSIDGQPASMWCVLSIESGQVLDIGTLQSKGARVYICVRGGLACPDYLGSKSTFTLGKFGGHNGMALKAGDVLQLSPQSELAADSATLPAELRPPIQNAWCLRVLYGPHGAPEFFTAQDVDMVFGTDWEVHYNSSRTGVRLIGPAPQWARSDGGEAGLHPSNIHDNAYAFGTVDFTGDMPVILGPDGPSLGGFVCPATVIAADLWKIGQLRAGDTVRFQPVSYDQACSLERTQQAFLANPCEWAEPNSLPYSGAEKNSASSEVDAHPTPVLFARDTGSIKVVYRLAGDNFLLVEYGEPSLDLVSRFRVHALMQWLETNSLPGIIETTPGIRSLQIHYDSQALTLQDLMAHLEKAEMDLERTVDSTRVPSRVVHLPLSWDDEACREAIDKYDQLVRKDAPWFPSNLEFIRRINGLDSLDDVKKLVFEAAYLVMGLGDVYLGAPVATPVNPAHRLVTTKYNPARTWTAENSVGIGGSYLCIYGMEGPGGYQFVGRTLQMWNRYKTTAEFTRPWLLRFFDQIRFYEVSHEELLKIRRDFPHGRYPLKIENTEFSLADYEQLVAQQSADIAAFQQCREKAFAQELQHWRATGQYNIKLEEAQIVQVQTQWPDDCIVVVSPVSGSLWQLCAAVGDAVEKGQVLLVLESMKMEINVVAPDDHLHISEILFEKGQQVSAGQPLVVLQSA
ncbi:MAG: urea carboxylase [Granulosicoccus sp.]